VSVRLAVPVPELAVAMDIVVRDYMAVRRDETVLITADTATDPQLITAIMSAAQVAGARVATIVIPQLPFQGGLADPYIPPAVGGAAAACDVWIDVTWPYMAGSHIHDEAIKSGKVRYLLCGDLPADGFVRLFGRVDLDLYYEVHSGFDKLTNAAIGKIIRITNNAGSDVSFTLAKPGFTKPRRATAPGTYFVPGSCTMFPEPASVKGTLCLFAVFHEYFTHLASPIALRIDGRIRELSGGGNDQFVLDRALRRAADGEYGHIIHFTHGIHPTARVTGNSFIEDMRATGNDAVGMGVPFWLPGGGENHPDAIIALQSIWVDGVKIAEDGRIVNPPHLAKLAERLAPKVN
jgi:2,5-dihydroxypyridine 5,6-dioxygenase